MDYQTTVTAISRFRIDEPDAAGRVQRIGLQEPRCEVLHRDAQSLVLKVPGSRYWSGRGLARSYGAAEVCVAVAAQGGWWLPIAHYPVRAAAKAAKG